MVTITPMNHPTPSYDQLTALHARLHRLDHLGAIAGWDQAANMPPKGNEARAAAMAELATLTHRLRTDATLPRTLEAAEQEDLTDAQRANLREIRRDWRAANALPESLVERRHLATSRCEHAWRSQRPANDWAGFLENFRDVVAVGREEAARLSEIEKGAVSGGIDVPVKLGSRSTYTLGALGGHEGRALKAGVRICM